jgi:hypothetical protein
MKQRWAERLDIFFFDKKKKEKKKKKKTLTVSYDFAV